MRVSLASAVALVLFPAIAAAQTVVDGSAAALSAADVEKVVGYLQGKIADPGRAEVRSLIRGSGSFGYCGEVKPRGGDFVPFYANFDTDQVFVLIDEGDPDALQDVRARLYVAGCFLR